MHKNLPRFALFASLAGAASLGQAQSSVTIYGVADIGYRWSQDNVNAHTANRSGIDSGTSDPSRLGFKGSEDLGHGLKAGFVFESGWNIDTGTVAGGGFFSRQSFASLSGPWGSVAAGRQYTPGYLMTSAIDPFGSVTVGQYNNIYLTEYRWDNQISYLSPTWNGLSLTAGYSKNGYGDESINNEGSTAAGDIRAWSVVPQYQNGPLLLAAHAQALESSTTGIYDGQRIRVYDLGATYDFGLLKLAALYGVRHADHADFSPDTGATEARHSRQWLIGATIPVGPRGKLQWSYTARASTQEGDADDARSRQWAVGYDHALSRRSSLYAVVARVQNNAAAKASETLAACVGAGYNAGEGYQRSFSFGFRHVF